LNPIEAVWAYLKRQLNKRRPRPLKKNDVQEALQKEWDVMPQSVISDLFDSMPRRVRAVIHAQGGFTSY